MAGGAASEDGAIYDINVTPLVDITLVLLIIMMVTAKVIVSQGKAVELPKAATGEEMPKEFSVDVLPDGKMYVKQVEVPTPEAIVTLAKKAKEDAKREKKKLRAVIRADSSTEHQEVRKLIEALQEAEVSKVAFAVTPVKGIDLDKIK